MCSAAGHICAAHRPTEHWTVASDTTRCDECQRLAGRDHGNSELLTHQSVSEAWPLITLTHLAIRVQQTVHFMLLWWYFLDFTNLTVMVSSRVFIIPVFEWLLYPPTTAARQLRPKFQVSWTMGNAFADLWAILYHVGSLRVQVPFENLCTPRSIKKCLSGIKVGRASCETPVPHH